MKKFWFGYIISAVLLPNLAPLLGIDWDFILATSSVGLLFTTSGMLVGKSPWKRTSKFVSMIFISGSVWGALFFWDLHTDGELRSAVTDALVMFVVSLLFQIWGLLIRGAAENANFKFVLGFLASAVTVTLIILLSALLTNPFSHGGSVLYFGFR